MSLDQCVQLTNVRLSFPHIAEPQKNKENPEKATYSAEFILEQNDPAWALFMQMVHAKAVEKWKEHANNVLQLCQQDRKKRCYGWGQEKQNQKTFKIYDGYEGKVFITAGNKRMPQIIDGMGQPVDPANTMVVQQLARKMYGGCRVNATIKPWLQENEHGRGVRCELVAIQFMADDAPFGEAVVDASSLYTATPTASTPGAAAPGWAPPGMPGAVPGAPSAPAWPAPQGMPPAPFPGVAGAPAMPPGMTPPPSFGAPSAAPGAPSFLR